MADPVTWSTIKWDEPRPGVARITLSRPERLNAYTPAMCRELLDGFARYTDDDALRVLIVTGEGGGFCAGGDVSGEEPDINAAVARPLGRARELREDLQAVVKALWDNDKPVIAAVNGVAVSGGLAFALACDLRIAATSARLGDTSGRVGLLPDEGGAWLFPRFMGRDHAFRMVALAELYSAEQALAYGLVTEVVPDDELERRTLELATAFALRSPVAVRVAKTLLRQGAESTLDQALLAAQSAVMWVNAGADAQEGLRAFREKRPPDFPGR
jgi:enoyl-CoA hydratase/carnithine racemase